MYRQVDFYTYISPSRFNKTIERKLIKSFPYSTLLFPVWKCVPARLGREGVIIRTHNTGHKAVCSRIQWTWWRIVNCGGFLSSRHRRTSHGDPNPNLSCSNIIMLEVEMYDALNEYCRKIVKIYIVYIY